MPTKDNSQTDDLDETIIPPGPPPIVVSPDDADEPDDEPAEQPERRRDATGKWTAKKTERAQGRKRESVDPDLRTGMTAMETRISELIANSAKDRELLLAAVSGRNQQAQQQAPQQIEGMAEVTNQLTVAAAQLKAELSALAKDPTRSEDGYLALLDKRAELIADKRALEKGWGKPQQQEQRSGIDPEKAARLVTLKTEFGWLATNQAAVQAAQQFRNALLRSGSADTIETDREACAMVARRMNLGSTPPPSQRTRQALGGPPPGVRGGVPGARRMEIPAHMLEGSGLTKRQVAHAVYGDEE